MQYPSRWYAHIVGGFLWGLLVFLVPPGDFGKCILSWVSRNPVLSLFPILIVSYLLGIVSDSCLLKIVRPILCSLLRIVSDTWRVNFVRRIRDKLKLMKDPNMPSPGELLELEKQENVGLNEHVTSAYLHMVFLRSIVLPTLLLVIIGTLEVIGSNWNWAQRASSMVIIWFVWATLLVYFISFRGEFSRWREYVHDSLVNTSHR